MKCLGTWPACPGSNAETGLGDSDSLLFAQGGEGADAGGAARGHVRGDGGDEQHERGSRDVPAQVDCRRLVEQALQQPGHRYCTADPDDGTKAGKPQPACEEQS